MREVEMRPRVVVLGVTGMLGHVLLRELHRGGEYEVFGSARDSAVLRRAGFPAESLDRVTTGIDVSDHVRVRRLLERLTPMAVVNCVGVIKQRPEVTDAVRTIELNALFPHWLARECSAVGARLIQVSTDCVFSGRTGGYTEADQPDPPDLYGRSKLLGEVTGAGHLTLRTSIIGHELSGHRSLIDWFLSQSGTVRGYTGAIYTGVTTWEFARLLRTVILPDPELTGLFQVASSPISKYDLLRQVGRQYDWDGQIVPFDDFSCDRSLSGQALFDRTG